MNNKNLIVLLIQQDLKHNQLVEALWKAGLNANIHALQISDIVASLMGMREEEISDQWTEIYFSFLDQAHCYKISEMAEDLKPLAEECYNTLLACKNIEDRTSHRTEI